MYLELEHINKSFGDKQVVRDLSFGLARGEILCILGASGCGKTTTLNMIGGFLTPDSGHVRLDGQDITNVPPERRPVTTVFQSYGLFPHMSVLENVTYGLKFRGMSRRAMQEKGMAYLELVGPGEPDLWEPLDSQGEVLEFHTIRDNGLRCGITVYGRDLPPAGIRLPPVKHDVHPGAGHEDQITAGCADCFEGQAAQECAPACAILQI